MYFLDLEVKGIEEVFSLVEESMYFVLVSSYGRRIYWLFSLVFFGNVDEDIELLIVEFRLEFFASGVILEVSK